MTSDHRNPAETLDCRKANLRHATKSQQQHNQRLRTSNTSGHKGVQWNKSSGNWSVEIYIQGKRITLGRFPKNQLDRAAQAYKDAAVKFHGEFANFG